MQHMHKLGLVGRSHHANARHHAAICNIEHAVVRRAIVAHEPRAIEAEHHIRVRKSVINYELVKRALHERRVDAYDGLFPAKCQAARKRHRVFFSDTRIDEALRELLGELGKTRAVFHGSCDSDDIVIRLSFGNDGLREHARIFRRRT